MRTKYSSNSELSHIWANDPDPSIGKRANSMSCNNGRLYSYATCIAQIINDTVIYNTASYSITTSKQQGYARSATNHFNNKIYLDIPQRGLHSLEFSQFEFNHIIESSERKASQSLLKASRSKKYSDMYNAEALSIFSNLEQYASLFNLKYEKPNLDHLRESALKADKEAKAIEKVRKAERIKEQAEALINWRKGEDVRNRFEITALRIKEDQIETTKGARIPVDHAVKFWGLIKSWHEKGVSYVKDHHSIHLGNYSVNRFENDVLTVGCHSIPYSEIENIAHQLSLN
ncbi:hypothetical protein UFOVP765_43 [uncultured Caudovirales phage]|uniref:Uncharacterized protein n=1 Tax=uncultured Caudovirales phage TaxID=2100421 RepID=A0A6J5NUD6_9CAUD|nr:hypothetical protein UFOVP765_43 [uncultured Caudovirales phage]